MPFDPHFLQEIKNRLDLRDLVEAELGQGKPSGETMRWACPFHQGDNPTSFAVSAGHYQCWSCEVRGDLFRWLMQRHGLTFKAAVEVAAEKAGLQLQPSPTSLPPPKPRPIRAAKPPLASPPKEWQQKHHHYIKRAEAWLWHRDNRAAVEYLRGRGLREETIRRAHLGYDPNRQIILLPWYIGGELWRVGARSLVKGKTPAVAGYRQGLYNADQLSAERPALLLEGEFDALIVAQEAGDLVTPVATGGITAARQTRWVVALARLPEVWVAFDDDPPGGQAAEWWLEVLAHNARRQRPIGAKDPNAMHLAGMDLRQWLGEVPVGAGRGW